MNEIGIFRQSQVLVYFQCPAAVTLAEKDSYKENRNQNNNEVISPTKKRDKLYLWARIECRG